jgi:membrane protease YdiL (CAAX protease family)
LDSADRRDFAFYGGGPAGLTFGASVAFLAGCAAGFAILMEAHRVIPGGAGRWIGSAALVLLPFAGLVIGARTRWMDLFHGPTARDVIVGLAFIPAAILIPALLAIPIFLLHLGGAANPAFKILAGAHGIDRAGVLAMGVMQLFGEELICILPFTVFLNGFVALRLSRKQAILLAWLASALLFALLHLPTYSWRWVQVLVLIGAGRLVLTGPYLISKSIWASFITHVGSDGLVLAAALALESLIHRMPG